MKKTLNEIRAELTAEVAGLGRENAKLTAFRAKSIAKELKNNGHTPEQIADIIQDSYPGLYAKIQEYFYETEKVA